ncbi:MAG: ZIP family metal transporter [Leptospiraceae bacterium]|nr:ZIP family metal transporter [Leptospiraceae bacterium]MCB1303703.1 ZIP family metal transporter [Leptospiraceae bacterium]
METIQRILNEFVLLGAAVAFLSTGLGAVPVMFKVRFSARLHDITMGICAGVMLGATFFSLILPAMDRFGNGSQLHGASLAVAGLLLGGALLHAFNRFIPHEHFFRGAEGQVSESLRRLWLFVFAIGIHNLPEGMAVGVGTGTGDEAISVPLMTGIGLQNIPEGMIVALALISEGFSAKTAILVTFATGLVESVGVFLGATAVGFSATMLPWGLSASAGAMLYIISSEMIPETQKNGFEHQATAGLMVGFAIMMLLDNAFVT